MKKLIFTMIYTIPVVLLVFVLGRNLTLDDNTLLDSQTQTKTYTKQEESVPKETSVIKETKQKKDNLEQSGKVKKDTKQEKSDNTSNIKIPKESDTLTNILVICTVPSDNSLQNPPDKFSVLSLDSANNKILFTPIPLDISVDIPGIGSKKLSDTYSWGDNTDLLLEAIKSKFDTNITRVIEINTESISEMTELFNEMGIDMTEEKLLEYLNETKVSKAMAEDIKSIPIFKYPKLISCMKPYIKTNMDTASLIKYGIITYKIVSHG